MKFREELEIFCENFQGNFEVIIKKFPEKYFGTFT